MGKAIHQWSKGLAITISYTLLAMFSLHFFTGDGLAAMVWLPSGLALASLLVFGMNFWPAIFIAALLGNTAASNSFSLSLGFAFGNSLQAIAACYFLTKKKPNLQRLSNLSDLTLFSLICAVSALIAAANGALMLLLISQVPISAAITTLIHWWQGDFIGLMFFTPLLLELHAKPLGFVSKKMIREYLLVTTLIILLSTFLFTLPQPISKNFHHYSYLMFTLLLWSSLRFGLHGSLMNLSFVWILGLYGIANHHGIFYQANLNITMLDMWLYLISLLFSVFVVSLTVQQRHQFQQRMDKSEKRMEQTLKAINQGLYDINLLTGTMYTNEPYALMMGYDPKTFSETKYSWSERIHPEDKERINNNLNQYLRDNKKSDSIEYRLRCNDGSYIWVVSSYAIVERDKDGHPIRLLGTQNNIEEQKQQQKLIKKNEKRYRALIDNVPFSVFEVSRDNRLLSINQAGLDMIEVSDENDAIGENCLLLTIEEERERNAEYVRQTYGGKAIEFEITLAVNGKNVLINLLPLYNSSNEIYAIIGYGQDITEKKKQSMSVWRQANFDNLTKLPNRNQLIIKLNEQINKSQEKFALLFIDLDRFKEVNDTLGHNAGDILLQQASNRMKENIPKQSLIGRQGGDEFCVILPNPTSRQMIDRIAKDIIDALNAPFNVLDETLFISASIGITLYPDDASSADDLLKYADLSMYVAKNSGRNGYRYFSSAMEAEFNHKTQLHKELRQALDKNQFCLLYQPIYHSKTNKISKVEALLRWEHPTKGLISPDKFIELAEETGLIIDIGYFAMKEAIAQYANWSPLLNHPIKISINKSPIEFYNTKRNFVDDCLSLLKQYRVAPDRLIIEITENVLLETPSLVMDLMLKLKQEKIEIALDDFGTGYSSLAYLNKLDIDYLKIDKSFIANIAHSKNDASLCEAIIVMAHKLGLSVIAEGVETKSQAERLDKLKCDFNQGYYYSRPIDAKAISSLLEIKK